MKPDNQSSAAITTIAQALASGRLTINALDDGSGVVLDVEREQMLTMNATGIALVQAINNGADTAQALVDTLTARFEVTPEQAARDVHGFLKQTAGCL